MGIAAYNRGSACIAWQMREEKPSDNVVFMNDVNALPKIKDPAYPWRKACMPFERGEIIFSHGVWWLTDASKPSGRNWAPCYPSIRALVRSWDISLVDRRGETWFCENNQN